MGNGAGEDTPASRESMARFRLNTKAELARDALAQVIEAYDEWRESALDLREVGGSSWDRGLDGDGLDAVMGFERGSSWAHVARGHCRNLSERLGHFSTGGDQGK